LPYAHVPGYSSDPELVPNALIKLVNFIQYECSLNNVPTSVDVANQCRSSISQFSAMTQVELAGMYLRIIAQSQVLTRDYYNLLWTPPLLQESIDRLQRLHDMSWVDRYFSFARALSILQDVKGCMDPSPIQTLNQTEPMYRRLSDLEAPFLEVHKSWPCIQELITEARYVITLDS
jgi:hypothetical protein